MILRVKNIAKIKIKGPKIAKLMVKDQAMTRKLYIRGPKLFTYCFTIYRGTAYKNKPYPS